MNARLFQARHWVGLVLGLALSVMTVGTPLLLHAQAAAPSPKHETLMGDVTQLQKLMNNAYFLELASEACASRAVDLKVVAICTNIHGIQMQQVANARWAMTFLTGKQPYLPTLSAAEQATITNLLFGNFANESDFVSAFGNAMVTKFQSSLETSALCAGIGFAPMTVYFCSTLYSKDASETNAIQDYLTMTLGNTPAHKSH